MNFSPESVKSLAIFGIGQFGFAIAKLLGEKYPQIPILAYDTSIYVETIERTRQHPTFHKGISLSKNVKVTCNIEEVLHDANLVFLAIPGQSLRAISQKIRPLIKCDTFFLILAKSLESETNKYMSEILEEELKSTNFRIYIAALGGGMIAGEVAKNFPISADVACSNLDAARFIAGLIETDNFNVNVTTDIIGVQLCGALKNIIAIGAGFFDGMNYSASSKSAYISMSSNEFIELALHLGSHRNTFCLDSQAWTGDLLTTCFGDSRNRYLGELIGKGHSVDDALAVLKKERKISEGYYTTRSFYMLSNEFGIKMPILEIIYSVLYMNENVKSAIPRMWASKRGFSSTSV